MKYTHIYKICFIKCLEVCLGQNQNSITFSFTLIFGATVQYNLNYLKQALIACDSSDQRKEKNLDQSFSKKKNSFNFDLLKEYSLFPFPL